MRLLANRISVVVVLLSAFLGCTSASTSVTSPTSVRCPVDLDFSPATIDAAGGGGEITIGTNRECTWDARSESEWISLASPTSGQGEGHLTFTASANPAVSTRLGVVLVNDQRIEIAQAAAACTFALSAPGSSVDAQGGTFGVTVSAQESCAWTAVSQADWIHIGSGASGDGRGAVSMRAEANGGTARQGTVLIAGQVYTVSQAGAPSAGAPTPPPGSPPPPPSGQECTFSVSPTAESIDASGGSREVRVQASGSSCTWTASSNVPWIDIRDREGHGNGSARYTVMPNDGAARSGTLMVAGSAVSVTQEAASEPGALSLHGRISGLSGQCPNLTFMLESRTIRTSPATSMECDKLRERDRVTVVGLVQPDGAILAQSVSRGEDD